MPSGSSSQNLNEDIKRAVKILNNFTDPEHSSDVRRIIPYNILANAHGLLIIRLQRVGVGLSWKGGNGIVIGRLPDGSWSAPSGIAMNAVGYGHQLGADVTDAIIVMNYRSAIKAFMDGGGQIQLGATVSASAGPLGRSAGVAASASSNNHYSATYVYSVSKGLYAGYAMEGTKISERRTTNAKFYGRTISAQEILTGTIPPPAVAQPLYDILARIGAGPRPGLPFASRKAASISYHRPPPNQAAPSSTSNSLARHSSIAAPGMSKHQYPAAEPSSSSGRPQAFATNPNNYANMNSENVFDEPPPPYTPPAEPFAAADTKNPAQFANTAGDANGYGIRVNEKRPDLEQQQQQSEEPLLVVAKYDYKSQEPGDLTFNAGDHIVVTKRMGDRNAWWEGEIGNRRGTFPANYTEDVTD